MNTSTLMITEMVSSTQNLLSQVAPGILQITLTLFLFFVGWQIVTKYLLGGVRRAGR